MFIFNSYFKVFKKRYSIFIFSFQIKQNECWGGGVGWWWGLSDGRSGGVPAPGVRGEGEEKRSGGGGGR